MFEVKDVYGEKLLTPIEKSNQLVCSVTNNLLKSNTTSVPCAFNTIIFTPPVGQKSESALKISSRLFISRLALSITQNFNKILQGKYPKCNTPI